MGEIDRKMTRLFTALEIPDPVKEELSRLEPKGNNIKVQNQPHITLHFIGKVSDIVASSICSELNNIELNCYTQAISGVGAFYRGKTPHSLWAGVDKCNGLNTLHSAVGSSLSKLGIELDKREYRPHITIARLRSSNEKYVQSYISNHENFKTSFSVKRFCLYSYVFEQGKPVYTKVQEYNLINY
mgnify:CR=1 FL=1